MAAKTEKEMLEGIETHLEALHTKHDATNTKLDALGSKHDVLSKRLDSVEQRMGVDDKGKMEREEKERADAAKRRADAALPGDMGEMHADASTDARNKFAAAQLRLDAATQAWGHQCRAPLAGESLRNYRISILNGLKAHSKAYRDSDLGTIGDENAFTNIEGIIVNDAIQASMIGPPAGAPLRKTTTTNEHGHRITRFTGDPLVTWAPFMGGSVRFGRINRHPGA